MTDYMKEAERLAVHLTHAAGTGDRDAEASFRAALLAHIQRGVPEGWQLVPKEPTDAMRAAVIREQRMLMQASNGLQGDGPACDQYRAMLAAAPDHFRDAAGMVAEPADDRIAAALHYPECWDTAAYPTVESALAEVCAHYRCTEHDAPAEVPMPEPGVSTYEGYRDSAGEWHAMAYSADQMRNYGDAREAAGYARGLKSRELTPEEKEDAVKYLALLRGEVKP